MATKSSGFLPAIEQYLDPNGTLRGYMQDAVNVVAHPKQAIASTLPAIGATVGAIGGGMIPGPDLTGVPEVAGAGIGTNVGEYAKDKILGQPYKPLSGGNLTQTALNMATEGTGQVLKNVVGKVATGIADQELKAPLQQFKTTPSDVTNFAKTHGTGILDYLNKFKNAAGSAWDGTAATFKNDVLAPLNQQYHDLLGTGDVRVQRTKIEQGYDAAISREKALNPATTDSPKVQALEAEKQNTLGYLDNIHTPKGSPEGYTPTDYDAQIVNSRKTYLDNQTPSGQFNLDPATSKNIQRTSGDILRNSLYDASDASGTAGVSGQLKQTGIDLKAANDIAPLADKTTALQETGQFDPNAGGGNKLLTRAMAVRGLIEGGVGAGVSHLLHLPPEVGGLVTPPLAEAAIALKNPLVKGADTVMNNAVGANGLRLAGQGISSVVGNQLTQNQADGYGYDDKQNPAHSGTNNSTFPLVMQAPPVINGVDITHNYDPKTAQWAPPDPKAFGLPKDAPQGLYTPSRINQDLANPANAGADLQSQVTGVGKASQDRINNYLAANNVDKDAISFAKDYVPTNNQMNTLASVIARYGTGWINNSKAIEKIKEYNDPQFGTAVAMMGSLNLQNIKEIQGRAPTQYEQKGGASMFPEPTDSPQTALAKLNQIQSTRQQQYATYAPYLNLLNQYNTQDAVGAPPVAGGGSSMPAIAARQTQPAAPIPTLMPQPNYQWNGTSWVTQ